MIYLIFFIVFFVLGYGFSVIRSRRRSRQRTAKALMSQWRNDPHRHENCTPSPIDSEFGPPNRNGRRYRDAPVPINPHLISVESLGCYETPNAHSRPGPFIARDDSSFSLSGRIPGLSMNSNNDPTVRPTRLPNESEKEYGMRLAAWNRHDAINQEQVQRLKRQREADEAASSASSSSLLTDIAIGVAVDAAFDSSPSFSDSSSSSSDFSGGGGDFGGGGSSGDW